MASLFYVLLVANLGKYSFAFPIDQKEETQQNQQFCISKDSFVKPKYCQWINYCNTSLVDVVNVFLYDVCEVIRMLGITWTNINIDGFSGISLRAMAQEFQ